MKTEAKRIALKLKATNDSLNIKSLIKETLYNSTAQSIIKIIETPCLALKVYLLLCVILSSSLCSHLLIQLILSYFSHSVSTASRTLYETPSTFPKITICNLNPFSTKYALEFLKKINKELQLDFDIFNETKMNKLGYKSRKIIVMNT